MNKFDVASLKTGIPVDEGNQGLSLMELLDDAERYRWLRSQYAQGKQTYFAEYCSGLEVEIDKTIDAEMGKNGG